MVDAKEYGRANSNLLVMTMKENCSEEEEMLEIVLPGKKNRNKGIYTRREICKALSSMIEMKEILGLGML